MVFQSFLHCSSNRFILLSQPVYLQLWLCGESLQRHKSSLGAGSRLEGRHDLHDGGDGAGGVGGGRDGAHRGDERADLGELVGERGAGGLGGGDAALGGGDAGGEGGHGGREGVDGALNVGASGRGLVYGRAACDEGDDAHRGH